MSVPQTVTPCWLAASRSIAELRIPDVTSSLRFGRRAKSAAGNGVRSRMAAARAADKSVVIYPANETVLNELVFSTFTKESGIAVQPVSAGSGVLVKRISSEKERPQGDIIWGVSRSLLQSNTAYFAPYH